MKPGGYTIRYVRQARMLLPVYFADTPAGIDSPRFLPADADRQNPVRSSYNTIFDFCMAVNIFCAMAPRFRRFGQIRSMRRRPSICRRKVARTMTVA